MHKPDSAITAQQDAAPPLFEPPKKPEWPAGILLSKPEKHACHIPDDLCVLLTPEAFEQLYAYAYATAQEISCMGVVRRDGNCFIVERFHLVKQEGGMAHTEMDPAALGTLMEDLLAQGKTQEARSLKCWAHSHPNMGVFWSKTDDTTCRLLATDYLVSLVVSDGFAIRARIDVGAPLGLIVDHVPVYCQLPQDRSRLDQYAKEVAKKVRMRPVVPVLPENSIGRLLDETGPWSDYFQSVYGGLDDTDLAELEALREDPLSLFGEE